MHWEGRMLVIADNVAAATAHNGCFPNYRLERYNTSACDGHRICETCGITVLKIGAGDYRTSSLKEAEAEFYKREALLMGRSDA